MSLDPKNVPAGLHSLLGYAEEFGIGDDVDRPTNIEAASEDEIRELAKCLDEFEEALYGWLCGPESKLRPVSCEFVAFVNLTLAVDHARHMVERANRTACT